MSISNKAFTGLNVAVDSAFGTAGQAQYSSGVTVTHDVIISVDAANNKALFPVVSLLPPSTSTLPVPTHQILAISIEHMAGFEGVGTAEVGMAIYGSYGELYDVMSYMVDPHPLGIVNLDLDFIDEGVRTIYRQIDLKDPFVSGVDGKRFYNNIALKISNTGFSQVLKGVIRVKVVLQKI